MPKKRKYAVKAKKQSDNNILSDDDSALKGDGVYDQLDRMDLNEDEDLSKAINSNRKTDSPVEEVYTLLGDDDSEAESSRGMFLINVRRNEFTYALRFRVNSQFNKLEF